MDGASPGARVSTPRMALPGRLAAQRMEGRLRSPSARGTWKDARGCCGRLTSPVPHTMRGLPHGTFLLYCIAARVVTLHRDLERIQTRCLLLEVARWDHVHAALEWLACPGASKPSQ